jgi:4-hydroxythreonine-4-phosphate dehydrogenase
VVGGNSSERLRGQTDLMQRVLITPGEPAGIGPDICLSLANKHSIHERVLVADPSMLEQRAKQLGIMVDVDIISAETPIKQNQPGTLRVIPVNCSAPVTAGQLNTDNAQYVLDCLTLATSLCLSGKADALVTGPVQKSVINDAGIPFTGHTEFLQQQCNVNQVVMMLATDELKVALVTTHLPLRDVADAITQPLLNNVLTVLLSSLSQDFGLTNPRLLVAGLNPHAGEGGHLGDEEIRIISPVLKNWQAKGHQIVGPLPADTLYAEHWLEQADCTLAMYHDQGLPVLKHQGFGRAVNITLGLPIVRTSVDHGTALDLAGTGKADAGSLDVAIRYAEQMAMNRHSTSNQ